MRARRPGAGRAGADLRARQIVRARPAPRISPLARAASFAGFVFVPETPRCIDALEAAAASRTGARCGHARRSACFATRRARSSPMRRRRCASTRCSCTAREDADYVAALRRDLPAGLRNLDSARASAAIACRSSAATECCSTMAPAAAGRLRLGAGSRVIPSLASAHRRRRDRPAQCRAPRAALGAFAIDVGSAVDERPGSQVAGQDRGACSTRLRPAARQELAQCA